MLDRADLVHPVLPQQRSSIRHWPTWAITFGPPLALMIFVGVGSRLKWFQVGEITMDPAAIAHHPTYFGAISTLGCFLWAGTAAACALTATFLSPGEPRRMFIAFGALTIALLLDDWLLLHEYAIPTQLHVPELGVFGCYGVALLVLLTLFRRRLLQGDWLLLTVSLVMFAVSMVTDAIAGSGAPRQGQQFIEDGAKLLGVAGWFGFFFAEAVRAISARSQ